MVDESGLTNTNRSWLLLRSNPPIVLSECLRAGSHCHLAGGESGPEIGTDDWVLGYANSL